jgi:hypothetical protein
MYGSYNIPYFVNPTQTPRIVRRGGSQLVGFANYSFPGTPIHVFAPIPVQVSAFQQVAIPIKASENYDRVSLIILTSDAYGNLQILLPTTSSDTFIAEKNTDSNPDFLINRMRMEYGLSNVGKLSKMKFTYHRTNINYKIGILYIPNVSCRNINSLISYRLDRFNLNQGGSSNMYSTKGNRVHCSEIIRNLTETIKSLSHQFI